MQIIQLYVHIGALRTYFTATAALQEATEYLFGVGHFSFAQLFFFVDGF